MSIVQSTKGSACKEQTWCYWSFQAESPEARQLGHLLQAEAVASSVCARPAVPDSPVARIADDSLSEVARHD